MLFLRSCKPNSFFITEVLLVHPQANLMLVAPDVLIDTSRSLLYFDKVFLQPKAPYTFSSLGHPKERTHGRIGVIEDWWIPDRPEGPFDPLYLRTTCLEPCNGEEGSWLQKPLHISEEDLCQLLIIPGL